MWLLPSLRRPANLARFFAACNVTGTSTPGMVIVDRNDWNDHENHKGNLNAYECLNEPPGWFIRIVDGVTQGDKIREVWDEVKDCAWIGLIGDDCIPETPNWDRLLVSELATAGIVSCNDGWQAPQRIANCWIIAGPLVRAVGYIFPGDLDHLFVDDIWEALGSATGAWQCRMDVMVRHAHVMKGETEPDETHRAAYGAGFTPTHKGPDREAGLWAGDEAIYQSWRQIGRRDAIAAIHQLDPPIPSVSWLRRAKTRSVFIATPVARNPVRQYNAAALATIQHLTKLGISAAIEHMIGNPDLPRARNELSAAFLASGKTDCIMIDDDIGWDPGDIIRLLASPHPLIGGVAAKRNTGLPDHDPGKWCCRWLGTEVDVDQMGNMHAATIGTGFMKIAREVFEKMIETGTARKLTGGGDMPEELRANYYRFFQFPEDPDEPGEDYDFCNRWRELGGKVWFDPSIRLVHVGEAEYSGDITALFRPPPQ